MPVPRALLPFVRARPMHGRRRRRRRRKSCSSSNSVLCFEQSVLRPSAGDTAHGSLCGLLRFILGHPGLRTRKPVYFNNVHTMRSSMFIFIICIHTYIILYTYVYHVCDLWVKAIYSPWRD